MSGINIDSSNVGMPIKFEPAFLSDNQTYEDTHPSNTHTHPSNTSDYDTYYMGARSYRPVQGGQRTRGGAPFSANGQRGQFYTPRGAQFSSYRSNRGSYGFSEQGRSDRGSWRGARGGVQRMTNPSGPDGKPLRCDACDFTMHFL